MAQFLKINDDEYLNLDFVQRIYVDEQSPNWIVFLTQVNDDAADSTRSIAGMIFGTQAEAQEAMEDLLSKLDGRHVVR